jgi:small conductance mechanosensitive channel
LPEIYLNGTYLMTVTQEDGKMQGTTPWDIAKELEDTLPNALERAKRERQQEYLVQQGKIAAGIAVGVVVLSLIIAAIQRHARLQRTAAKALTPQSISDKLSQEQERNLHEVENRLLQVAQVGIWGGGILVILGMFPYTRPFQVKLLSALQIPAAIALVIVIAYIGTRLSYVLIDRFASSIAESNIVDSQDSRRLELRIDTITSIMRSAARFAWVGIGIIIALSVLGIGIGSILAGVGIVGLIVTLAFRNLFKGALNSFFIIMEDQYAVGDVIVLKDLDDVGGLVENMDLRITQLRNAQGRLITVPNSQVSAVSNFSFHWARSDLKIPIPYDADVERVLELIGEVAQKMNQDTQWQDQILDDPQVLGIDDFTDRGLIIRLWIKVKPLKQWDVSREYRRRLKLALNEAEIAIPVPHQQIRFDSSFPMQMQMDGQGSSTDGRKASSKTKTRTDSQEEALQGQMEELAQDSDRRKRRDSSKIRMDEMENSSEDEDGDEGDDK